MRIFDIIKSELNSDKLKLEEEFERVINDKTLETEKKVATIKKILKKIATIKLSFEEFEGYITVDNEDDETNKE